MKVDVLPRPPSAADLSGGWRGIVERPLTNGPPAAPGDVGRLMFAVRMRRGLVRDREDGTTAARQQAQPDKG
jgi:hypothetical protein